ncbi:FeoA domain-containing protein [Endothiovibrio diazotrophicus]
MDDATRSAPLPRPLDEISGDAAQEVHSVYGNRAMLRRILRLGLLEGCRLSVTARHPSDLCCRTAGGTRLRLPRAVAHCIWVVPGPPDPAT